MNNAEVQTATAKFAALPQKCQEVAILVGKGYTSEAIAGELRKKVVTVKRQLLVCYGIMGVESILQLAIVMYCKELSEEDYLGSPAFGKSITETLTPRQLEVAHYIVDGYRNLNIAANLGISEKTVKRHITDLMDRLGVSNRVEIAHRIIREEFFANRNHQSPTPQ